MEVKKDFKELLVLLNAHSVEYIVVGAFALAFHGAPRYTGDLDVFVHPTPDNAQRILEALKEFGFGDVGLTRNDFSSPDKVVQLGYAPTRIDIITSLTGVSWEEVDEHKIPGNYDGVPIFLIGKNEFIANKRAIGRSKDIADVEALGEAPNP